MDLTADKKIRISYISALVILFISLIIFFFTTNKVIKNTQEETRQNAIIAEEAKLLSTLKDMETVYRGYLLLNNKESLNLFTEGKANVTKISKKIKILIGGDTVQLNKIGLVDATIKTEIALMESGLQEYLKDKFTVTDSVKKLAYSGKVSMDDLRQQLNEMQLDQYRLITKNAAGLSTSETLSIINKIALVIFILVAIYCGLTFKKDKDLQKASSLQVLKERTDLEQKVELLTGEKSHLAELESMEKFAASGRMARMIAHEVRNPLTNIGLANDQLKDVIEINEESSMLLNMIKRNGERINLLIGELLHATKFGELHCSNISVNNLLDEVLVTLNDQLENQQIEVQKNYAPNLKTVNADPEKIKMVFFNIILNAIEAIKTVPGILQISTAIVENQCVIKFIDNGNGIEQDAIPKLFEPFYTSKNKGNGLGLTNAQNIVLNHKGKIKAESAEGQGACFTIGLPCS